MGVMMLAKLLCDLLGDFLKERSRRFAVYTHVAEAKAGLKGVRG